MEEKFERAVCPRCGRRFFDVDVESAPGGRLRVQCPRCKSFTFINLSFYGKIDASQDSSAPAANLVKAPEGAPLSDL